MQKGGKYTSLFYRDIHMTQAESKPEMIYRYRAFDERTLDILLNDSVYFANPSTFNDPLDCSPTVVADTSIDQLESLLTYLVLTRVENDILKMLNTLNGISAINKNHAKNRGEEEARKFIENVKKSIWSSEYTPSVESEYLEFLKKSYAWNIERELLTRYVKGVCCFSMSDTNPLLWSHYANNHKGICIGYSLDRIPSPKLLAVEYGGSRILSTSTVYKALIQRDQSAIKQLNKAILLRKAEEWKYEQELRMIGDVGIQDSPLKMREIIFGLKCPATTKFLIVNALRKSANNLEFKEIGANGDTYKLEKKDMDGEDIAFYPLQARSPQEVFSNPSSLNFKKP